MKTVAFLFGLFILAVGACGLVAPDNLSWIARRFATPGSFYGLAAVRIAFGVVLVIVAPTSRMPKALRVLGYVILVLGIVTALTGLLEIGNARASIDWWMRQGPGVARLTCIPIIALGGFVAYACAPGAGKTIRPG